MKNTSKKVQKTAAMLLAALMVVNSVDLSAFTAYAAQAELVPEKTEQSASSKECVMTITDFEKLEEDVMQQLLPVGASEEEIIFPDTLNVTVSVSDTQEENEMDNEEEVSEGESESKETVSGNEVSENVVSASAPMTVYAAEEQGTNDGEAISQTKNVTLTGVAWEIDPAESDGEVFDSCEDCDGYCYVYTPVLPETDEDGNKVTLGDNVETPVIYVLIGEGENQVSAIAEGEYTDEGFCEGYSWVDGVLTKNTGDGATTCTHGDTCNGYQPASYDSKYRRYAITNAGQLYWFADYVNSANKNENADAVLTKDITVNSSLLNTDGTLNTNAAVRKWTPIGLNSFKGRFDGQNHTISGIYCSMPNRDENTGLFGFLEGGTISNVTLTDSYIEGKNSVGGICGRAISTRNEGVINIENCKNNGRVTGQLYIGGICGLAKENFSNCLNIEKCINTGGVTGQQNVGGICGSSMYVISHSYNTGEVSGTYCVGGIVGHMAKDIAGVRNVYNIGTVTGTDATGVIWGAIVQTNTNARSDCYYLNTIKKEGTTYSDGNDEAVISMTSEEFSSGKVAWLLNGSSSNSPTWYQNIDNSTKDSYPVLDSAHGTVYASSPCPWVFSNTQPGEKSHDFEPDSKGDTEHICKNCAQSETHAPTYTADNSTHTISKKCDCGKDFGSFTLSAPAEDTLTYNGTAKEASVSGEIPGVTDTPTISYFKVENGTETLLTGKPTDVGEYKASISCGSGENTATAYVIYEITAAEPTVSWSGSSKTVYYTANSISPDKLPALKVTGVDDNPVEGYTTADFTYYYRESADEAFTEGLPTNLGDYEIKATVNPKGNYTGAETTEGNYLKLTIDWLDTTDTATLKDQYGRKLSGDDWWAQSVTFTAPAGYTISWKADEKDAYGSVFSFSNNGADTGSDGISYTYYLKNSDGEIAEKTQIVHIDRTAPTFPENGGITIGDTGTWWKELLNTITFGLAYRNTVEVKVCGTDGLSGVDKYYYYIDASGNTTPKNTSELAGLSFQSVNADGSNAVTVKKLENTGDTKNYVVYVYAVDKAGNRSSYICSNGVVVDAEAPTLTLSTPTKDDATLTDSSATITLNASEAGTYFYILEKNGEAIPSGMGDFATETSTNGKTTWTAKDGITSGSMVEGDNSISLASLDANTKYTLYVVAVDSVGNGTASVQSKAFTTLKLNPTITGQPTITGTYGQKLSEMNLADGTAAYGDSEITGAWSITDTNKDTAYPTVNGTTAYEVTFKPTEAKYAEVTVDVIPTVEKATPYIDADTLTAERITYGQTLADSSVQGRVYYDSTKQTLVEGSFVWKDRSIKPTAKDDSNTTRYTVIFRPTDSANYNEVETEITITVNKAQNAPNMPGSTMSVQNSITKVGDVTLPQYWVWQESDKDTPLEVEVAQSATALYEGADKGNYERESVEIMITRSACDHVNTTLINVKSATCMEKGYSGDTYCNDCKTVIESGRETNYAEHKGGTATCKKKAVCDYCHQEYGSTNPNNHAATEVRGYRAATYAAAGYTGDTYCKDCEQKIKDGTVIPILKRNDTPTDNGDNGSDNGSSTVVTPQPTPVTPQPTPPVTQSPAPKPILPDKGKQPDKAPFIKGENGKEGWDVIREETEGTPEGNTVTVDMNGASVVPSEVLSDIKGRDVTLVFDMGNGITWSVNGMSITGEAIGSIDFGVTTGAQAGKTIPVDVLNNITGERTSLNVTLAHDGEFGFTAVLSINMKSENAGLYANLFYYNESTGELEFICCDRIREDGTTDLTFTHASDYTIVVDSVPMDGSAKADDAVLENGEDTDGNNSSAVDVTENTITTDNASAWNPLWFVLIGVVVIVAGLGVFLITKKKQGEE